MADPRRIAKLERAIQREIAEALVGRSVDPRADRIITITRVELSQDLSHARVFWSLLGGESQKRTATRMFADGRGYYQTLIAKRLDTRTVPHLTFQFDEALAKETHISNLIDDALASDKRARGGAATETAAAAATIPDDDAKDDED
jgi:ribosome-binding factor A